MDEIERDRIDALRIKAINDLQYCFDAMEPKKQKLLAYWISDYARFLGKESDFDPQKLISYKRGAVVKVHLGFRIGSEEGGLHYAVVIDDNARSSPVATIVPLSSVKPHTDLERLHLSKIFLGDQIYRALNQKIEDATKEAKEIRTSLFARIAAMEREGASLGTKTEAEARRVAIDSIARSADSLNEKIENIQKMQNEIAKMKCGSIALVGQITTVSKIRIYDPLYPNDVLAKIRLSEEAMDKIDEKIRSLFTKKS